MTVDAKKAAALARKGVMFVCATCKHMHEGIDRGSDGCNRLQCGSPLQGRMFPEYDGPLTWDYLKSVCMFTGQDSNLALRLGDSGRVIGISENHVHLVEESEHGSSFFLMYGDQIIARKMERRVPNLAEIINNGGL